MHLALENITADQLALYNIEVTVLRLDKIHPLISGNKWFKLHPYLEEAAQQHKRRIITFGGAWSNHIVATAAACRQHGFLSVGIIRGEQPPTLSSTLLSAKDYGMQLHFIDRKAYRENKIPAELLNDDDYLVPQGGYGKKGAEGAAGILRKYEKQFTHCCCAVGTGTTMAGLINAALPGQKIIGISAARNDLDLGRKVDTLVLSPSKQWEILHDYHFGGFAKFDPVLLEFMNSFYRKTHIPSDIVYTGKLFFAVNDLIYKKFFPPDSKVLVIHSGGLQGNDSLDKGKLIY